MLKRIGIKGRTLRWTLACCALMTACGAGLCFGSVDAYQSLRAPSSPLLYQALLMLAWTGYLIQLFRRR